MKKLSLALISATLMLSNQSAIADTWTSSLAHCQKTSGSTDIQQSDLINYNRVSILNDANTGIGFSCPVELKSNKAITKIQVDVSVDTASSIRNMEPTDPSIADYFPKCSLWISYNTGGSDLVALQPEKSVAWGNYNRLAIANPTVQNAGNGSANTAVLRCTTGYYTDQTRLFGLRITYAD